MFEPLRNGIFATIVPCIIIFGGSFLWGWEINANTAIFIGGVATIALLGLCVDAFLPRLGYLNLWPFIAGV